MNYWIISDTHFSHTKLEEWGQRSGDWQEQLWQGLREIPDGDTLIHLGDICIGDDAEVHEGILANTGLIQKILVRGNHDNKTLTWYAKRWDFVCDSFELIYNGHYLYFSHRPQPEMGHFTRNIHGHTHGGMHHSEEFVSWYLPEYHLDVSPELMGYKPLRLDTLIQKEKVSRLPTRVS